MKFTSEDLMKAMGLNVGDKIKVKNALINGEDGIFTIVNTSSFCLSEKESRLYNISQLINQDFEILPNPKRVGDLKCDKECNNCPLRALESCNMFGRLTLYELLDKVYNDWENKDQEIYDLLKARLDKEVVEE